MTFKTLHMPVSQRIYNRRQLLFLLISLRYTFILLKLFLSAPHLCCFPLAFCSFSAQASHCGGFSCCRARALQRAGFSTCGTLATLPCALWNLPGPGIEPMSPALAGRFLTTGPPGKSYLRYLKEGFNC